MPYRMELLAHSKLQLVLLNYHWHLLQTFLRTVSHSRSRIFVILRILHLGLFVNVVRPSKIPAGKQLPVIFVRLAVGFPVEFAWSHKCFVF